MRQKVCISCKCVKGADEFYKSRGKDLRARCKACTAFQLREWRRQNVEANAALQAAWYERQKLKLAKRSEAERKAYLAKRAEISKRYRVRHAERLKAQRLDNIEQARHDKRRHEATRRRRGSGKISRDEWMAVVAEAGSCCFYCGAAVEKITIDHIIPLAKGGVNKAANLVGACTKCNASKAAADPIEWIFFKHGADALARLLLLAGSRLHGSESFRD